MVIEKLYTSDSEIPFFAFDVPLDIVDKALSGAIELRYFNDVPETREPIVSNMNSVGRGIKSVLDYVSYTAAHTINSDIANLLSYVRIKCGEISRDFYGIDVDFEAVNSTVLFYEEGSEITPHNHFPYALVSAIYLNVEQGCSPITLGNVRFYPRNGLCIVFPGHLTHSVEKTKSRRTMITADWKALV
jgi:hypothetical protein